MENLLAIIEYREPRRGRDSAFADKTIKIYVLLKGGGGIQVRVFVGDVLSSMYEP